MNESIYIICNSSECLQLITGHNIPRISGLHNADLFTCNSAYTFFRTTGRHFNFWTDTVDIIRKVTMPETLSQDYQKHVEHIFSPFGLYLGNGNLLYRGLQVSPVKEGCSSALGALAYLAECHQYKQIYLVGYTLDETTNPVWKGILDKYAQDLKCPYFYVFNKK